MNDRKTVTDFLESETLVGISPDDLLVYHGPTKRYVDRYLWHSLSSGLVACYSPTERDVKDHFGIFRGVDQIEAFAQALGSWGLFKECKKLGYTPAELKEHFIPRFISIGSVYFHNYLEKGDVFISIGHVRFYKFRQQVTDGRIYKVPAGLDLEKYFSKFSEKQFLEYDLPEDFILVSELFDVTGRAMKTELIKQYLEQNGKTGNN